ncbi:MAG: ATP-binding protein [Bacteroidetes bacterium]|nr:ATP-binding protein [Bacteroidota bacterium]
MKKMLSRLLPYLRKMLVLLEQNLAVKQSVSDNAINSLAPKVLTNEVDLSKIQPYLSSLKSALETPSINNIAITGSYGSGKSTILRTFQHHHREYEYLNVSLASFKDNKEDKNDFERKLEVSILQQMFYHVKPDKIPDSRFKRIVNLTTSKLLLHTAFFLLWLNSAIILFNFDYINKLNSESWSLWSSL